MNGYSFSYAPVGGFNIPCVMPTTTAEPSFFQGRGSRPYSVTEILRSVFQEDFHAAMKKYTEDCPAGVMMALGNDKVTDIKLVRTEVYKVESSLEQSISSVVVDLLIRGSFEVNAPTTELNTEMIYARKRMYGNFRLRYILNLAPCHRTCMGPVAGPLEFFPADEITMQKTSVTNQYLLPIMYAEDYPRQARRMLERYYPEALKMPTPIDGEELARRMNLKIRRVRFEWGSNIQGRIYFDTTKVTLRDRNGQLTEEIIDAGTILINTDLCPTKEMENSTIVHECVHMFLDLPFFLLQMLSGRPFCAYTSRKRKKKYSGNNTPIDWMELQAEKLPAYILMEETNTRKEIERLLAERGGDRIPETMGWIMRQLAHIFQVSRSMAKYRMIELGYPEAEGIYGYIDNRRIPDYGCEGPWQPGTTYTISLKEASALYGTSREFAKQIDSGDYAYLEGHFCLNMEPYVCTDRNQVRRLTEYARHHIELCSIAFSVGGRYSDTHYEEGQAARKTEVKDKYLLRHEFVAAPGSDKRMKENADFMKDAQLWMQLKADMPDTTREAVQKIIDLKGVTQELLAARLGVNRKALNKWCMQDRMSINHMVGICVALKLRPDIAEELVRLTGYYWRNNKHDNLLHMMLYCAADLSVERCNEILQQEGYPKLNEGKDDSLREF